MEIIAGSIQNPKNSFDTLLARHWSSKNKKKKILRHKAGN